MVDILTIVTNGNQTCVRSSLSEDKQIELLEDTLTYLISKTLKEEEKDESTEG